MNLLAPLGRAYQRFTRQYWSSAPTSITPEAQESWEAKQFRYYASNQPFTSPLTLTAGNLTGETWEMRHGYREWALKEPSAKAALQTKCLAVCQLDPQLKARNPKDRKDRAAADWVKEAVRFSAEGWPGLIWNMLYPSLTDGFSVVEPGWGRMDRHDPQYPGWWHATQFASIDTNYIRFRLDTHRQVIGVQSIAGTQGAVAMNPKDFIIFTHCKLFENPFGVADMRAAVRACQMIEASIRLRQLLLQNYSGPYLVASAKDSTVRSKLRELMNRARANGWIVVPDGTEVKVMDLATSGPEKFQAAIEDMRKEVVTAIQGAYLQLLEGGVPGGRGNTETHRGVAELFIWWLATWVAQVINRQLIPMLVEPQFGNSVGMPQLTLGGIDEEAVGVALERFRKGYEMDVPLSMSQVREVGGFETPSDAEDTLKRPQQQQPPDGGGGKPSGGVLDSMFNDTVHVNRIGGPDRSGGTFRGRDESAALADLLG